MAENIQDQVPQAVASRNPDVGGAGETEPATNRRCHKIRSLSRMVVQLSYRSGDVDGVGISTYLRMGWATVRPPLVIEIPGTYHTSLSGNQVRRGHWGTRSTAANDLKHAANYAALQAVGDPNDPYLCFQQDPWPLVISYVIGWEHGRRRVDEDNCIAAMKHVRDRVASVLGIDDKEFVTGSLTQERDPNKVGFIRVTVVSSMAYVQVPRDWYERAVEAIGDAA